MAIETAVWRALAVFRTLGLVYAFAVYARRYDEYAHPAGGWVVLGAMTVWTVVVGVLYSRPAGRRWPILGLDLAIATVAVVLPACSTTPPGSTPARRPCRWSGRPPRCWRSRSAGAGRPGSVPPRRSVPPTWPTAAS